MFCAKSERVWLKQMPEFPPIEEGVFPQLEELGLCGCDIANLLTCLGLLHKLVNQDVCFK